MVFFCKQKTAYEMRISDWSSDVCSSDLHDRILVVSLHAPVDQPDLLAETLLKRPATILGGGEVDVLRLLDQRADPVDLRIARKGARNAIHHLVEAVERERPGLDRLAARRPLGEARDVHVAVGGEHERERKGP